MTASPGFLEDRDPGDCPAEMALRGMRGRWKLLSLRQLIDGVLTRSVHPEVPPRLEDALTARGRDLIPLLEGLHAWGAAHPAP